MIEEFKLSVYGENYDENEVNGVSDASRKRKAIAQNAVKESANYDWAALANTGTVTFQLACLSCFRSWFQICD